MFEIIKLYRVGCLNNWIHLEITDISFPVALGKFQKYLTWFNDLFLSENNFPLQFIPIKRTYGNPFNNSVNLAIACYGQNHDAMHWNRISDQKDGVGLDCHLLYPVFVRCLSVTHRPF